MVDNRYATALVIGSVLSLLAAVYLSAAVGTQHWFQYSSPPANRTMNVSRLREDFLRGDSNEKNHTDVMVRLNGTLGLWWRCIQVLRESDHTFETECESFSLNQQFMPKYKKQDFNAEKDLLRTYLWRSSLQLGCGCATFSSRSLHSGQRLLFRAGLIYSTIITRLPKESRAPWVGLSTSPSSPSLCR
ncbi:hypothetical protein OJAV_G00236900 [Oryzias javanicus]|uniref:Claudin domain-containing protein 1 n=1 Tax=Oryzias javanicus TaxID=123683 RepID=A0A437BY32_ORYJA|nr:hypothetical protein OJAV_G00236900 [Oryzias javanicus]